MCARFISGMARSKTIFHKTRAELELMREANLIVSKTLAHLGTILKPGITGFELDRAAEEFIRDHGAIPSFKGLYDCPSSILTSVNDCVVHGLPTAREYRETDLVSIDVGAKLEGFHGDSAYTFAFKGVDEDSMDVLEATNQALYVGIEKAQVGNRVGEVSYAIQRFIERECGYAIVRELSGHGIGREFHEAPEVPNFGKRTKGPIMKPGLVIAIEPMVNTKTRHIKTAADGWTILAKDGLATAHFEHSVAITREGPWILSDHSFVEETVSANEWLHEPVAKEILEEEY